VPSPSAETRLEAADVERLLDIAEAAIVDGLFGGRPSAPPVSALPPALRETSGVFVTLTVDGSLNGCIGCIEGVEPLGHAVPRHAWAAAFADPRLPSLRPEAYERLLIEISVLSPLSPIPADSREDLLAQLRPHVDGLVVAAGGGRALFLPSVWEQLPQPEEFLDHLQLKAGLPPGRWPPGMLSYRFTATKIARKTGGGASPAAPPDVMARCDRRPWRVRATKKTMQE